MGQRPAPPFFNAAMQLEKRRSNITRRIWKVIVTTAWLEVWLIWDWCSGVIKHREITQTQYSFSWENHQKDLPVWDQARCHCHNGWLYMIIGNGPKLPSLRWLKEVEKNPKREQDNTLWKPRIVRFVFVVPGYYRLQKAANHLPQLVNSWCWEAADYAARFQTTTFQDGLVRKKLRC